MNVGHCSKKPSLIWDRDSKTGNRTSVIDEPHRSIDDFYNVPEDSSPVDLDNHRYRHGDDSPGADTK